jgi:hypothetical protein
MTQRTDFSSPKLSPFVKLKHPTTCSCCGERLEVDAAVVQIIRANPSRTGIACALCWRKACACALCLGEITPEVEHFIRWIPERCQFVGLCLVCAPSGGLERWRALS